MSAPGYTGGTEPYRPARPSGEPSQPHDDWAQPGYRTSPPRVAGDPRQSSRLVTALFVVGVVLAIAIAGWIGFRAAGLQDAPSPPRIRAPRSMMAPVVSVGQTVDFVGYQQAGLVTVLDHQWVSDPPESASDVLAVHLSFEATEGTLSVLHTPRVILADGQRLAEMPRLDTAGLPALAPQNLEPGEVADGWVFFELPRQDVTFLLRTSLEEVLRLEIVGGSTPAAPPPAIPIASQVHIDQAPDACDVLVEGVEWLTAAGETQGSFLAVKTRLTPTAGRCQPFVATTIVVGDETIRSRSSDVSPQHPAMLDDEIFVGDSIVGWRLFEVEPQPVALLVGDSEVPLPVG